MKKYLSVIFFSLCKIYGQTILNGNFENNSGSQQINQSNTIYNSKMLNSIAFGTYENLDIIKNGETYGNAQDGNWFVGIGTQESTQKFDAFSLELSDDLVAGNTYKISYYDKETDKFNNIGGCVLQIGSSQSGNSFGDLIYTASKPVKTWTQHSFNFVAPNKSRYITIKAVVGKSTYGFEWTLVDNFVIKPVLAIKEYREGKTEPAISIKPVDSKVFIRFNKPDLEITLSIYSITGKLVYRNSGAGVDAFIWNTSLLRSGDYLIRINVKDYSYSWNYLLTNR
jgi:hypothetical protein